jgi:hypothetical protein
MSIKFSVSHPCVENQRNRKIVPLINQLYFVCSVQLWIVDGKHFYVGSANFDWRSLTQVKEVGLLVKNCACLAQDVVKIWDVYWILGT